MVNFDEVHDVYKKMVGVEKDIVSIAMLEYPDILLPITFIKCIDKDTNEVIGLESQLYYMIEEGYSEDKILSRMDNLHQFFQDTKNKAVRKRINSIMKDLRYHMERNSDGGEFNNIFNYNKFINSIINKNIPFSFISSLLEYSNTKELKENYKYLYQVVTDTLELYQNNTFYFKDNYSINYTL